MEILIKISDTDVVKHPNIFESVRAIAEVLTENGPKNEACIRLPKEKPCKAEEKLPEETAVEEVPEDAPEETTVEAAVEAAVEEVPEEEESSFTIEELRKELAGLAKKKGNAEAKKLLLKFGADKLTDLTKAKYNAFADAIKEVV